MEGEEYVNAKPGRMKENRSLSTPERARTKFLAQLRKAAKVEGFERSHGIAGTNCHIDDEIVKPSVHLMLSGLCTSLCLPCRWFDGGDVHRVQYGGSQ